MKIVPVDQIPTGQPVPQDDLLEIYKICTRMEKLCTAQQGVGLSAVQVGIPWNLFIILRNEKMKHYEYYVDCEYKPVGEEMLTTLEGCLSLRDDQGRLRRFEVPRYRHVRVTGKCLKCHPDLHLEDYQESFSLDEKDGYMGVVFQHEIDHHHGKLVSDFGVEVEILK